MTVKGGTSMKSNDELPDRLSVISQIDLAPVDKSEVWGKIQNKINEDGSTRIRYKSKRFWGAAGSVGAAVAAVALVALTLNSLHMLPLPHMPTMGSRGTGQFTIAINPNSVTATPLDTASFRNAVQSYLERHSLSNDSYSYSGVFAEANQAVTVNSLPVTNTISNLAVRWSQLVDQKYGFAYLTYLANGTPGIADVLALKTGTDKWAVQRFGSSPPTISAASISNKFGVYPSGMRGTGFETNGSDQINYEFLAGLIVNPSITRIQIVRKDGVSVNVPITNGAFGYVQVGSKRNPIPNGSPKIKAYNNQGNLVFNQP
jgi:hypothetical protein